MDVEEEDLDMDLNVEESSTPTPGALCFPLLLHSFLT
jgi:hypothetical protein